MAYVVGNQGVIKDPFVVEELERLQAYLKGLEAKIQPDEVKPDQPVPTTKGDPTNPDRTTPPVVIGQRWPTGPWIIGVDGDGAMPKIPSYAVQIPSPISTNQNNFALNDSAIIVEFYPTAAVNLTGMRIATRHRRVVGLLNRGSHTLSIVNQSTASETTYRFSWGDSGDANETVDVPTGAIVWVFYDATSGRWRLFGVPAVGPDHLPPSLSPDEFPPRSWWIESFVADASMTIRGHGEATPTLNGGGVSQSTIYGYGARRDTGTAVNDAAGYFAAAGSGVVTPITDPIWEVFLRTESDITDVLIWACLETAGSSSDTIGGGGAAEGMGFRYSTGASDPGWVGVTRDGTTQAVTGLVAAIATSSYYRLRLRKSGSTVYFSVNGGTEVAHTSNLPQASTSLFWDVRIFTKTTAVRSLTFFRHWMKPTVVPT